MALGLESNIAETAKAFQGNPQALQQRYTQKQDLFDLLALNMIKKQQAAAKNQLVMSQQKMPGTILEQTEGAVTKNASEAVAGVKGALDTKNAQSKANMNKMAGVAGAPAPNMAKMAGGGIVGFAAGDQVKGRTKENELNDLLRFANLSRDQWEGLSSEAKQKFEKLYESQGGKSQLSKDLFGDSDRAAIIESERMNKGIDAPGPLGQFGSYLFDDADEYKDVKDKREAALKQMEALKNMKSQDKQIIPIAGAGSMQPRDQSSLSGIAAVTPEITEKKDDKPVVPGVGVDSFSADKSGGAPAVGGFDASKFAQDKTFDTKVRGGIKDLLDSDPQKAVDFASRTPAEQAMIEKLFKERTDMRDNRMNPDKLSSDRLSQMLLGAKGATAGEAFRTAGLAGINADRNAENVRRSEFDAINKLFMTEADKSQGIKQKAFEGSQADKKQGVASGSSLTANDKTAAMNADKLFATIENNKVANKLKSELNAISAKRVTAQENNTLANVDTALLRDLTNVEKSASSQFLKEYQAKESTLITSGKDKKERDRLSKQFKDEYELALQNLRDGIAAERDTIKNRLTSRTGGIDTSGFTVKKKS